VRVQPRVFRVGGASDTWHGRALAACLQCGPGAVLSHASAARLRGLDVRLAEHRLEITLPRGTRSRSAVGARLHVSARLTAADRATVDGLPVTTVARTLVDLAARLGSEELARVLDDAVVRRVVPLPVLVATAHRLSGKGVRGTRSLTAALVPWSLGTVESHAEAAALRLLSTWGLPAPVPQYEVRSPDGAFVARVDFAWPDRRLVLEVDGFQAHDGPARFVADRQRWNRVRAAAWDVVQVTLRELREDPAAVRAVLERYLLGPPA